MDGDTNIFNDVNVGDQVYSGPIFNETMCLIRSKDRTSGRLCVPRAPMVLAPIGDDLDGYQGVLGLSRGEMNYMRLLKENKVLLSNVVALNYDEHDDIQSSVRFGNFNKKMTKNEQLFVLPNADRTKWAMKVYNVQFGSKNIDTNGKLGFIDSGNATIQLPKNVYDQVVDEIRSLHRGRIRLTQQYEFGQKVQILKIWRECEDIIDDLPDLIFEIAPGVTIKMDPKSYVFRPQDDEIDCRVSLAASNENVFRFGTQFLKNFYTVLDYDQN